MRATINSSRKSQSGMLLIEAMVAILIFTIGVIALMGVQALAVRSSSDSKIRSDADFLVDQLFSEMIVDARTPVNLPAAGALPPARAGSLVVNRLFARYDSTQGGPGYVRWRDRVTDVANGGLPDAINNFPVVTVTDVTANGLIMARVDVIAMWRAPKDPLGLPAKRVVATALINE